MMQTLQAKKRETTTKSFNRQLRQSGRIPAVVYGKNIGNTPIQVSETDFLQLLRQEGINAVFNLNYDDDSATVMIREVQSDPIKTNVIKHVDFQEVNMKEKTTVDVPVETVGEAPGEKEGGLVQKQYQTVEVKCLPADIPEVIEVDISQLHIGESVTVGELNLPDGIDLLADEETVLVSILPPAHETEVEAPGDTDQAEPELVERDDQEGEDKPED